MSGGRSRVLFKMVRRRVTMEWEDCVKDVRRGLFLWMMDGEGRVLFGGMFRRSSFDTYICQYTLHTCLYIR